MILIEVADVSRVFSFEIYVAAYGSPNKVSTRLSWVTSLTTLSILFVVRIAFILWLSITGDKVLSEDDKFNVILNERSPGRTGKVEVFNSLTL